MNQTDKKINWLLKEKYGGVKSAEFEEDVKRLTAGEPVDYLIGFVDFLDTKIDLSLNPLIPRPETEYWCEKAIEEIKLNAQEKVACLDLFSGSGCIGIAILKTIKNAEVAFGEVDKKLIDQIKINLALNQIENRYQLIQTDIFSKIDKGYDFILANPPYVSENDSQLESGVETYEPHLAIFAGKDGLSLIEKFLKEAPKFLNKDGRLYMEFDPRQKESIGEYLSKLPYSEYQFNTDQYGSIRYLTATRASS